MSEQLTAEQRYEEAIGKCGGQGMLCNKCIIAAIRAAEAAARKEAMEECKEVASRDSLLDLADSAVEIRRKICMAISDLLAKAADTIV